MYNAHMTYEWIYNLLCYTDSMCSWWSFFLWPGWNSWAIPCRPLGVGEGVVGLVGVLAVGTDLVHGYILYWFFPFNIVGTSQTILTGSGISFLFLFNSYYSSLENNWRIQLELKRCFAKKESFFNLILIKD